MPSLSSSTILYSLPSAAVRFMGELHIQSPLVQGLCVAATSKPLLRPSSYNAPRGLTPTIRGKLMNTLYIGARELTCSPQGANSNFRKLHSVRAKLQSFTICKKLQTTDEGTRRTANYSPEGCVSDRTGCLKYVRTRHEAFQGEVSYFKKDTVVCNVESKKCAPG